MPAYTGEFEYMSYTELVILREAWCADTYLYYYIVLSLRLQHDTCLSLSE